MTNSAAINRRASAQDEHQDHQRHENELNMLFLDFGNDGRETSGCGFHGSPFVEWVEYVVYKLPHPRLQR